MERGLFKTLQEDAAPGKLVSLVRKWYGKVKARVKVNDVESEWFESKVGVRQGNACHSYFSKMVLWIR